MARIENRNVTDRKVMARKRKVPCCTAHKSTKRRPVKPTSGNFQHSFTFFEKINPKKELEGKYKEQLRIGEDGTKHVVRSADYNCLQKKLKPYLVQFQRSPYKNVSPNEHNMSGPVGKCVRASERASMMEEGLISYSKTIVWILKSDEDGKNFECYQNPMESHYTSTSTENYPRETNQHSHYYQTDRKELKITLIVRRAIGTAKYFTQI